MKVVLQIDGGIGKNIMATTLCKKIKQTYPDAELIVLTAYPPIFLCNVSVDRVLGPADLNYFYDIVSGNHAVKFFLRDPTKETDYISGNKHLLQVWFEMYGFDYKGEMPEVILSAAEINFYRSKLVSNKPLLAIQSNSGSGKVLGNYRWYRDLPSHTIKQVIDALSTHYTIVHIKREDQPAFPNTIPFQSDFRSICALLSIADRRLLINSFAQHAAAALNLPSTVCWIGQSPSILGYSMHDNILARQLEGTFDDRDAFTDKYASQTYANKVSPTPYDREENIFDIHELLDSLSGERIGKLKSFAKIQANKQIAENIAFEHRRGSMVASRLVNLVSKVDLSHVRQILDIGSRDLQQSLEFLNIFPNAAVDAFEPVPESFAVCMQRKNNILHTHTNAKINCHNLVLSDRKGTIPFYSVVPELSSTPNVGASSMFPFIEGLNGTPFGQNLVQKEIVVESTTLDSWCKENNISEVDIMWIDVQGAELLVMMGGQSILPKTKIIMTEIGLKPYYEGHTLKPEIDALLKELGFEELVDSFELNSFDYEANTIYINTKFQ